MSSLIDILESDGDYEFKAEQALRALAELQDKALRPDFAAAAQTFALLAIAETLGDSRHGFSVAGAILNAGAV